MATAKWATPGSWTDAFGSSSADINTASTIVDGYFVLSSTVIANGTNLDLYADLSLRLASITPTSGSYVHVYIVPLLDDGSTYPGSSGSSATANYPPGNLGVGTLAMRAAAGVQNNVMRGILLPPGSFKFGLLNKTGVTWATTGNVCKYRAYNESVA